MRYYYDDPLAALWMYKNFGMLFQSIDSNGKPAMCDGWMLTLSIRHKDDEVHRKFYIYEGDGGIRSDGCLHLLKEKTGDVVQDGEIILRDGIHFMWPHATDLLSSSKTA